MIIRGDKLYCGACIKQWIEAEKTLGVYRPRCFSGECRNADCQFDGLYEWLHLVFTLRDSKVLASLGAGNWLAERVDALNDDTMSLLLEIETELDDLIRQKQAAK